MGLGFCAGVLQARSEPLSNGILRAHNMIQQWDQRLDQLIPPPVSKASQVYVLTFLSLKTVKIGLKMQKILCELV